MAGELNVMSADDNDLPEDLKIQVSSFFDMRSRICVRVASNANKEWVDKDTHYWQKKGGDNYTACLALWGLLQEPIPPFVPWYLQLVDDLKSAKEYLAKYWLSDDPTLLSGLALDAAQLGNMDLVQWLGHVDRGDDRNIIEEMTLLHAAISGNLKLVKWLCTEWFYDKKLGYHQLIPDEEIMYHAIVSGNIALIQWLSSDDLGDCRQALNQGTLYAAAEIGHIHIIQWLCGAKQDGPRLTLDQETLDVAAEHGHIDLVQWLCHDERRSNKQIPTENTLDNAALSGSVTLFEWLSRGEYGLKRDQSTLNAAAESGNIDLVQLLCSDKYQLVPEQSTLYAAAESDNIDLVQLLCSDKYQLVPDQTTLDIAHRKSRKLINYVQSQMDEALQQQTFMPASIQMFY